MSLLLPQPVSYRNLLEFFQIFLSIPLDTLQKGKLLLFASAKISDLVYFLCKIPSGEGKAWIFSWLLFPVALLFFLDGHIILFIGILCLECLFLVHLFLCLLEYPSSGHATASPTCVGVGGLSGSCCLNSKAQGSMVCKCINNLIGRVLDS